MSVTIENDNYYLIFDWLIRNKCIKMQYRIKINWAEVCADKLWIWSVFDVFGGLTIKFFSSVVISAIFKLAASSIVSCTVNDGYRLSSCRI